MSNSVNDKFLDIKVQWMAFMILNHITVNQSSCIHYLFPLICEALIVDGTFALNLHSI